MDNAVVSALESWFASSPWGWEEAYFAGFIHGASKGETVVEYAMKERAHFEDGQRDGQQYARLTDESNARPTVPAMAAVGKSEFRAASVVEADEPFGGE